MSEPYFIIRGEPTIAEALRAIDRNVNFGVLLDKKDRLRGIFTTGDIRRGLRSVKSTTDPVAKVMNRRPVTAPKGTPDDELEMLARSKRIGRSPIILLDEKKAFAGVFQPTYVVRSRFTREINSITISPRTRIKGAMKVMDKTGLGIALVAGKDRKLQGLVTDRDIRKAVIKGTSIDGQITEIMNRNPVTGRAGMTPDEIMVLNTTSKSLKIPLLDNEGRVADLVAFYKTDKSVAQILNVREIKDTPGRSMKRILVTGGAGYLGSVLARRLLKRGYRVRILDNLQFGDESVRGLGNNGKFELVEGDVRHIESITAAMQDVDAVIHLAGIVGDPACGLDPLRTLEQNYYSTVTLAQVARHHQVNRFIFASSCSVYGATKRAATENSQLNPLSLYAKDKIYSEQGLMELARGSSFSPTILRMATLYGLSHRPRFDLVVNLLAAKAAAEHKFTIFGGAQWRPFVHVDDAATAYIKVLEAPLSKVGGRIFNVGSKSQNKRLGEIGEIVEKAVRGSRMDINPEDEDKRDYRVSFSRIQRSLSFKPGHSIKSGVKEVASAVRTRKIKNYTHPRYSNYRSLASKYSDE